MPLGNTESIGPDGQGVSPRVWTGNTWAVVSNKAVNTPSLGAEKVTNGGLEAPYIGGLATGWTKSGSGTPAEENVDVHGGSSAQKITDSGGTTYVQQNISVLAGQWLLVSAWAKRVDGNTAIIYYTPVGGSQTLLISTVSTSYTNLLGTMRNSSTGGNMLIQLANAYTNGNYSVLFDDIAIKPLTLSELFASCGDLGTPNVLAEVAVTLTAGVQGGVVICLDSAASPANFIIAYHDGTRAKLDKCVAGTYTSLISATATYAAGANIVVVKDGTSVSLYYNNALVGTTQTVSDAGIVNNTIHGLFATDALVSLDNFLVMPRGNENQYNILDRYIK